MLLFCGGVAGLNTGTYTSSTDSSIGAIKGLIGVVPYFCLQPSAVCVPNSAWLLVNTESQFSGLELYP